MNFVDLTSISGFSYTMKDPNNPNAKSALKALINLYLPKGILIDTFDYLNSNAQSIAAEYDDFVIDIRFKGTDGKRYLCQVQFFSHECYFTKSAGYFSYLLNDNLCDLEVFDTSALLVAFTMERTPEKDENDHRLVAELAVIDYDYHDMVPLSPIVKSVRVYETGENIEDCIDDQQKCAWIIRNSHRLDSIPAGINCPEIQEILRSARIPA